MAEVRQHLDRTVFAWIGEFDPVSPFYYRIYSPVIFIEFYHQPGVALPDTGYNRRHAHALVRTPNGNDYGRDLLQSGYPINSISQSAEAKPCALPAMTLRRSLSSKPSKVRTAATVSRITFSAGRADG